MKLTERIAAEAGGDVPFPFGRESDGAGRADLALILTEAEVVDRLAEPTGHIIVDGEPMAFWLPPGVTLSLGASCRRRVFDTTDAQGGQEPAASAPEQNTEIGADAEWASEAPRNSEG